MTNKNEPAFPTERNLTQGMTLRDYFAAKALQGILFEGLSTQETARYAYELADAMMEARQE
jgi:predicted RNA polymerase sigma factor